MVKKLEEKQEDKASRGKGLDTIIQERTRNCEFRHKFDDYRLKRHVQYCDAKPEDLSKVRFCPYRSQDQQIVEGQRYCVCTYKK